MIRLHTLMASFVFASSLLGAQIGLAQNAQPSQNQPSAASPSKEKKEDAKTKHSLTFEDELIEGSTAKPELFFLFQKKNFNYGKLIKLRENFVPEMRRSTDDIQRGRSTN